MRKIFIGTALASVLALVSGCSGSDEVGNDGTGGEGGGGSGDSTVEIISWWTGPGEAEALRALLDVFEDQNPGTTIFNAAADSGTDARALIDQRIADGEPPDVFQENVAEIPQFLATNPDGLTPLDDLFAENGWTDVMRPEVIERITMDGHIYAMPVGIHRENGLIYNRAVFTEHDLEPPTTLDELWTVSEALAAAGETPFATGGQGWILRIMFHSIALGTMGGAEYEAFFTGQGDRNDPALPESIQNFDRILQNYIGAGMLEETFGWQEASQAVHDGDAAMFLHGDWAAGYLQALGWEAGVDFGVVASPGAAEVFLFGVDAFALPADAPNHDGAISFFETIGSLEGQVAFNNIKGSTVTRLDVDSADLTPVGRATQADFASAAIVIGTPSWEGVDDAILAFALDGDEAALTTFLQDAVYPQ